MLYTLTEKEFKEYRECRSEIIRIYNQMINHYLTGNEAIDKNIERYAEILKIEPGNKYEYI